MDSKMEQILELIISSFSARAEITRIGDVIWDHMHFHNVECTDEYNDLTISKFLALFKVRYLNNLGIINENTAKSLENLLSLKNKLDTKLGELLRHKLYEENNVDEKDIDLVISQIERIDVILKKYNLLFDENNSLNMFLTSIESNNYQYVPNNEEIKTLIKEME